MPAAGGQAAKERSAACRIIEMEGLRIKLTGKFADFGGGHRIGAEIDDLLHVQNLQNEGDRPWLVREAEMHDVAVMHDIVLAFKPELAGLPGAQLRR